MTEHSDHYTPASNNAGGGIMDDPERLRFALDCCHRLADDTPKLVVDFLSHLPLMRGIRHEVEQILLRVATNSPEVILAYAEQVRHTPGGSQAIELARQNTDK